MAIKAEEAVDAVIDRLLKWQDDADTQVTTTEDDDADVIPVHDSAGRLIELEIRPGLQRELTIDEFQAAINEALTANLRRGKEKLNKLSDECFKDVEQIAGLFPQNKDTGQQLIDAFRAGLNG